MLPNKKTVTNPLEINILNHLEERLEFFSVP